MELMPTPVMSSTPLSLIRWLTRSKALLMSAVLSGVRSGMAVKVVRQVSTLVERCSSHCAVPRQRKKLPPASSWSVTSVKLVRSADTVLADLSGAEGLPQPKLKQARQPSRTTVDAPRSRDVFFMVKDGLKVFGTGFAKAKQFPAKGKVKTRLSWKLKLS